MRDREPDGPLQWRREGLRFDRPDERPGDEPRAYLTAVVTGVASVGNAATGLVLT